ncbi:three-prime repair exonuclease 1 [Nephila pilipes]|uniref:Three-prime repair exonuclease 1 n=1 Tax=Nephila pilipes TaxID=299642 RepID=A0A8X6US75_NEPPI|nr:three-prime repair exonuclease 1 [Nephila pilipes]
MNDFIQMMLPDSDPSHNKISTLVFMDLETTGLPSLVGKHNVHITEMSLVAVDRTNFENDDTFRVLNKLSLCIRPRSIVSPTAMTITGLFNDILEKQEKFDESIPKLLEYFFRRLRQPLCLLAHNGNRFDFPLLQAELKHINYALDQEILCADTLVAFRSITNRIYVHPPIANNENIREKIDLKISDNTILNGKRSISDVEADLLLSNDIELFASLEEPITENISECNSNLKSTIIQTNAYFDEFTTPKSKSTELACAPKPRKKIKPDTTWTPKNQYKAATSKKSCHEFVKRQLFENNTPERISSTKTNNINSKPTQFSLEKLYCHYFGENPPKSHYAEADCITLSKVCQKISTDFLKWIDENSTSFSETSAMCAAHTYDPNGSLCISTPTSFHLYECIHASKPSINCVALNQPLLDDVTLPEATSNIVSSETNLIPKSAGLSTTQQAQLDAVIGKFTDVFYANDDNIGLCPYVEFKIELQHEKPIRCRPYRLSEPDRQFLKTQIQKWLKQGICCHSNSPYAAPTFIVDQPFHESTPR